MSTVHPQLAKFALDLNHLYEELCTRVEHEGFFQTFGGVQLVLYTDDGLTLKFWDEGIEFYPETNDVYA